MKISKIGENKIMLDDIIYTIKINVMDGEKSGVPIRVYRRLDPEAEIILEVNTATSEGRASCKYRWWSKESCFDKGCNWFLWRE